jgi:hypothetical protein
MNDHKVCHEPLFEFDLNDVTPVPETIRTKASLLILRLFSQEFKLKHSVTSSVVKTSFQDFGGRGRGPI